MQRSATATLLALGAILLLALTSCVSVTRGPSTQPAETTTDTRPSAPTAACGAAFTEAAKGIRQHYDTHPLYGPESDALFEDGLTDEESKQLSEWIEDDNAKYDKIIDPVFDACDGWQDLYRGAYAQGPDSEWSLHGNEVVSDDNLKDYFVVSYCLDREDRRACADFVADDWE